MIFQYKACNNKETPHVDYTWFINNWVQMKTLSKSLK